jgi:hypothetical protein
VLSVALKVAVEAAPVKMFLDYPLNAVAEIVMAEGSEQEFEL